jgi:hypothetical protein
MKNNRKEAIKSHDKWYYTGKPCKHGHLSKRMVMDGSCYECRLERNAIERSIIKSYLKDLPEALVQ